MAEKLVIDRNASDNEYFHRDFHITADRGVRYIGETFGDDVVQEYLVTFTRAYYKPLIEKASSEGLKAIKNHIEDTYKIEKAPDNVSLSLTDTELLVKVFECPAVKYMKEAGYEPSRWYKDLTETVNRVIAEDAGFKFEMISYSEENGAAEYRFFK